MDQYQTTEELKKIILPAIEDENMELVELDLIRTSGKTIVRLLVDKLGERINLGECANLNIKIGNLLDQHGIIDSRYLLEVSSPGLDRPLKTASDFKRCLNRKARFFFVEPVFTKLELEGVISAVRQDMVSVDISGRICEIPLGKIRKAVQLL